MTSRSAKAPVLPPRTIVGRRYGVAGLFAGIGGLELGLSRAGHDSRLLCELEPGAQSVLRARMDVDLHGDICTLRSLPSDVDMVVAGFPCQDLSQAGRTAGIEGSRSGLVGEVFRLIRRRKTPWVLLENVPFMLQLSRGRAMEVIVDALEELGYHWAYRVVNSLAFGVPQRRNRVLLLAALNEDPRDVLFGEDAIEPATDMDAVGRRACGFYWTEGSRGLGWAVDSVPTLKGGSGLGIASPPAIVLPSGDIVTPEIRDAERMQGFEPGWTEPALSVTRPGHRWKLVGNAVTVDVASWLGHRLAHPTAAGRSVEGRPLQRHGAWPRAAWNVGRGRFEATISSYPAWLPRPGLANWLKYEPQLLSERATAGFLARVDASSLRLPPRFRQSVVDHLARINGRTTSPRPARRA